MALITATGLAVFAGCVVCIPLTAHLSPDRMVPGSWRMMGWHALFAVVTVALAYLLGGTDPYSYGFLYASALMVLCAECWITEDPQLFNGSKTGGWPFFLFRGPGDQQTKAVIPMMSYTRIFAAWHAGGVCLCCFMHVIGSGFRNPEKAQVSLALGLLWVIWASINSWRSVYGGGQFCQVGIMFHSLVGPGCGLAGYWHLRYWHANGGERTNGETGLLLLFAMFCVALVSSLIFKDRAEAPEDSARLRSLQPSLTATRDITEMPMGS